MTDKMKYENEAIELTEEQLESISGGRRMRESEISNAHETIRTFERKRRTAGGGKAMTDDLQYLQKLYLDYRRLISGFSDQSDDLMFDYYFRKEVQKRGRTDLLEYL